MNIPLINYAENWIKDSKGLMIYRGFSQMNPDNTTSIKSPKNRIPKNMPGQIQEEIDNWFLKNWGAKFRESSIFVTGSLDIAKSYAGSFGEVRILIPESDYIFCWSPLCCDLYEEYIDPQRSSTEPIDTMLNRLAYQCDNIDLAIKSNHEIMLICENIKAIKHHLI